MHYHFNFTRYWLSIECSWEIGFFIVSVMYNNVFYWRLPYRVSKAGVLSVNSSPIGSDRGAYAREVNFKNSSRRQIYIIASVNKILYLVIYPTISLETYPLFIFTKSVCRIRRDNFTCISELICYKCTTSLLGEI